MIRPLDSDLKPVVNRDYWRKISSDPSWQRDEFVRCASEPWYWFVNYVYTVRKDEKVEGGVKERFPAYEYLRYLCDCFFTMPFLAADKARQLTFTWLFAGCNLWLIQYRQNEECIIQSKKEEDSDTEIIRRAYYIWQNEPGWLKPYQSKSPYSFCKLDIPATNSKMLGVPAGEDQVRSHNPTRFLGDECGFWEGLFEQSLGAALACCKDIKVISTASPGEWEDFINDSDQPFETIIPSQSIHDPHGLKRRQLNRGFTHVRVGFGVHPVKSAADWAPREAVRYGGMTAPLFRREHLIDYKAYVGQRLWPMLSKEHQQVRDISGWTLYRIIDQGIRHPTVCLWVAVNAQGDRHIYKEYYANDRSIAMNCSQILRLSAGESIRATYIDPSTKKRSPESLTPLIDIYADSKIPCIPADNSFAGYDAVGNAAMSTLARKSLAEGKLAGFLEELNPTQNELLTLASKPALTFDPRFAPRAFSECCNLRWVETRGDETQKAEKEKPVDKDDDGPDCVRYAIMSPLAYKAPPESNPGGKIVSVNQLFERKAAYLKTQQNAASRRAYAVDNTR